MGMTTSPAAWSKPAAIAAVWPKLRRSLISLNLSSASASRGEPLIGVVAASVVHDDDLVAPSQLPERCRERLVERRDVVLLVVHGDDYRRGPAARAAGSTHPAWRSSGNAAGLPWAVRPSTGQYA